MILNGTLGKWVAILLQYNSMDCGKRSRERHNGYPWNLTCSLRTGIESGYYVEVKIECARNEARLAVAVDTPGNL